MRGLALVVVGVAALSAVQAGDASQNFRDANGDAHGGAADIIGVFVTEHGAGRVSIEPGAQAAARAGRSITLEIDADRNARTGSPEGFEYRLTYGLGTHAYQWQKWGGSRFANSEDPAAYAFELDGPCCGPAFAFTRAAIGGADSFAFRLTSIRVSAGKVVGRDLAPDRGRWVYAMIGSKAAGGATASIQLGDPIWSTYPDRLHAGKPFTVTALADTNAKALTVTCRGHIGSQAVPMKGRYANQTVTCSGVLPPGTAGKQLVGTIKAAAGSAGFTAPFSIAIGK
jgi:hypothetical protein